MPHNFVFKNPATYLSFLVVGSFFVLDQTLKHLANSHPDIHLNIIPKILTWELLHNPGIAFGLPLPNWFVITVTPIVLVLLVFLFFHHKQRTTIRIIAISTIFAGAISNYIDRFLFGITIDYLRVWTSVFNIADLMIIFGAILLAMDIKKKH